LPTTLEQTISVTMLSDLDTEIKTLQQRLTKIHQIKQGILQELLTGKSRLLTTTQKESANV